MNEHGESASSRSELSRQRAYKTLWIVLALLFLAGFVIAMFVAYE